MLASIERTSTTGDVPDAGAPEVPPSVPAPRRGLWVWGLVSVGLWVLLVAAGMGIVLRYEKTPGAGAPVEHWPASSRLVPDAKLPTLVMFAHPHCPCTRASLAELGRIMAECDGAMAARVVFVRPPGVDPQWERTDLWSTAKAMPALEVLVDDGAIEAACFGAATSGQVLLFGPDGRRMFAGGITGTRGHEGANDGHDAVCALVGRGEPAPGSTPVYGCPLCDREGETR